MKRKEIIVLDNGMGVNARGGCCDAAIVPYFP